MKRFDGGSVLGVSDCEVKRVLCLLCHLLVCKGPVSSILR